MAWFRDARWESLIRAVDRWFAAVADFCNDEGTSAPSPDCFPSAELIDGLHDVAAIDPAEVSKIYCMVETWKPCHDGPPRVPVKEIADALLQFRFTRDRIFRQGTVTEKPQAADALPTSAPSFSAIAPSTNGVDDWPKWAGEVAEAATRHAMGKQGSWPTEAKPASEPEGGGKPAAVSLGNRRYKVGDNPPLVLQESEDFVLRSLIELGGAASLTELRKQTGKDDCATVLSKIKAKQEYRSLAPFIILPGGKGKGGYQTTIRPAKA